MSKPDEQWWSLVAAEYVLGTLRGEDLELFRKILDNDEEVQAEVLRWEQHLVGLNESVSPQQPGPVVLPGIMERIRANAEPASTADQHRDSFVANEDDEQSDWLLVDKPAASREPVAAIGVGRDTHVDLSQSIETRVVKIMWPAIAAFATAASLLMGIMLSRSQLEPAGMPFASDAVSVVLDENAQALWLLEADFDLQRVRLTALSPPSIDSAKDFQLWQVLPDSAGVAAVGLLPEIDGMWQELDVAGIPTVFDAFAVSLEPEGGSPDAGPSGPVVYQSEVVFTRTSF